MSQAASDYSLLSTTQEEDYSECACRDPAHLMLEEEDLRAQRLFSEHGMLECSVGGSRLLVFIVHCFTCNPDEPYLLDNRNAEFRLSPAFRMFAGSTSDLSQESENEFQATQLSRSASVADFAREGITPGSSALQERPRSSASGSMSRETAILQDKVALCSALVCAKCRKVLEKASALGGK